MASLCDLHNSLLNSEPQAKEVNELQYLHDGLLI